jgi:hypothetical protein
MHASAKESAVVLYRWPDHEFAKLYQQYVLQSAAAAALEDHRQTGCLLAAAA